VVLDDEDRDRDGRAPWRPAGSTAISASIFGDGGTGWSPGAVAADLLGVLVAHKALLAVAGLVSVRDHT
jgi:hypothetical protein